MSFKIEYESWNNSEIQSFLLKKMWFTIKWNFISGVASTKFCKINNYRWDVVSFSCLSNWLSWYIVYETNLPINNIQIYETWSPLVSFLTKESFPHSADLNLHLAWTQLGPWEIMERCRRCHIFQMTVAGGEKSHSYHSSLWALSKSQAV